VLALKMQSMLAVACWLGLARLSQKNPLTSRLLSFVF